MLFKGKEIHPECLSPFPVLSFLTLDWYTLQAGFSKNWKSKAGIWVSHFLWNPCYFPSFTEILSISYREFQGVGFLINARIHHISQNYRPPLVLYHGEFHNSKSDFQLSEKSSVCAKTGFENVAFPGQNIMAEQGAGIHEQWRGCKRTRFRGDTQS